MNGIIHGCTHPPGFESSEPPSEAVMFSAIFRYIELLFGKIRPQKVFFLAVDGVAPRAKMNQQRARRFRAAKEARENYEKAARKGQSLPEGRFDSNCITPGTGFMARLDDAMRTWLESKIKNDPSWQGVQVIFTGHSVPGEGEHKVMEYIRLSKAQPDYDPNVRHCLYGLDADLIMLGLLSHDPHFALLREEVTFGRPSKTRTKSIDQTRFHLMHLCLLREYMDAEFSLALASKLSFAYSLERIIDDFILLAVFVGNDFVPNVPHLMINEGAFGMLFDAYKKLLPLLPGYLNEFGTVHFQRVATVLKELYDFERSIFESETGVGSNNGKPKAQKPGPLSNASANANAHGNAITKIQRSIFEESRDHLVLDVAMRDHVLTIDELSVADRKFVLGLARELNLDFCLTPDHKIQLLKPDDWADDDQDEAPEDDPSEAKVALKRVLKRYEARPVAGNPQDVASETEEEAEQRQLKQWKASYYLNKLGFADPAKLCFEYARAVQWVMLYYYEGVASWSWFYPFHYSPQLSDLTEFMLDLDAGAITFDLDQPLRPLEQLLAVLPSASASIIPAALASLMVEPSSPIIEFYPKEFKTDLNGKKNEWEAIVLIPFLDTALLIEAINSCSHLLSPAEKALNQFGPSYSFSTIDGEPAVAVYDLPTLAVGQNFVKGLCEGAQLGIYATPGFPTIATLSCTPVLDKLGVTIFGSQASRDHSLAFSIDPKPAESIEQLAKRLIGKSAYINWPYLQEAKVLYISDPLFLYALSGDKVVSTPFTPSELAANERIIAELERRSRDKMAVFPGPIDILVHAVPLRGMSMSADGALQKDFGIGEQPILVPWQMVVENVKGVDPRFVETDALPIETTYPIGIECIYLGQDAYGAKAMVVGHSAGGLKLKVSKASHVNDAILLRIASHAIYQKSFFSARQVAQTLNMSPLLLSKLTSTMFVWADINAPQATSKKYNIGLNLKFEGRGQKVAGYTRKLEASRGWEFSAKAVDLIRSYKSSFSEMFARLEKLTTRDRISLADLFPSEQAEKSIAAVVEWLREIGCRDLTAVPIEDEALDKSTVAALVDAFVPASSLEAAVLFSYDVPLLDVLTAQNASIHPIASRWPPVLGGRAIFIGDAGPFAFGTCVLIIGIEGGRLRVLPVAERAASSENDFGGTAVLKKDVLCVTKSSQGRSDPMRGQSLPPPSFHVSTKIAFVPASSHTISAASMSEAADAGIAARQPPAPRLDQQHRPQPIPKQPAAANHVSASIGDGQPPCHPGRLPFSMEPDSSQVLSSSASTVPQQNHHGRSPPVSTQPLDISRRSVFVDAIERSIAGQIESPKEVGAEQKLAHLFAQAAIRDGSKPSKRIFASAASQSSASMSGHKAISNLAPNPIMPPKSSAALTSTLPAPQAQTPPGSTANQPMCTAKGAAQSGNPRPPLLRPDMSWQDKQR